MTIMEQGDWNWKWSVFVTLLLSALWWLAWTCPHDD